MKKRILILDDDKAVLEILQILLDYEGLEVIPIEYTDDLFSLVRLHLPSLILLDFCLKGRSGGDWCSQLKKNAEFAAIPVIIFTASSKAIEKGNYGCDDFIAKPFDLEDLVARVKLLIDESKKVAGAFVNLAQINSET